MDRLHHGDSPDREEGPVAHLGKTHISMDNRNGLQLIQRGS